MINFESFDIRYWVKEGLTIALPARHPAKLKAAKRLSLMPYFLSSAALVVAVSLGTPSLAVEPSQSVLNWLTPVTTGNSASLEQDSVPEGYWPKLVSALKYVPLLLDDDCSMDPDPIV